MAWIKIPAEHHALFHAALPKDKRITTLQMFGATAAKVNGQLFGGLFARSMMVKLSPAQLEEALALDGAEPFDPMGTGKTMMSSVLLPESVMEDPEEMRAWLQKALDHTLTLPAKKPKTTKSKATKITKSKATKSTKSKATKATKATKSKATKSTKTT